MLLLALAAASAATIWADCVDNGQGGSAATVYRCDTVVGCGGSQTRAHVQVATCSHKCCVGGGFWVYNCGGWSNVGTCCDVNTGYCLPRYCGQPATCPFAIQAE